MTSVKTDLDCMVCQTPLSVRLAQGRKSGKPFLMLICDVDGRHFRGFISDRDYIADVIDRVEAL